MEKPKHWKDMEPIGEQNDLFHQCLMVVWMVSLAVWPLAAILDFWFPSLRVVTDSAGAIFLLTTIIGCGTSQARMEMREHKRKKHGIR